MGNLDWFGNCSTIYNECYNPLSSSCGETVVIAVVHRYCCCHPPLPLLLGRPCLQSMTALHPLQVVVAFQAVIIRRHITTIVEHLYSFVAVIHQSSVGGSAKRCAPTQVRLTKLGINQSRDRPAKEKRLDMEVCPLTMGLESQAPIIMVDGCQWSRGVYRLLHLLGKTHEVACKRAFICTSHF